jgi:hypothetical protein
MAAPGWGCLSEKDIYYSFSESNMSPCYMSEIFNWQVPFSVLSVESRSGRESISYECSENRTKQSSRNALFPNKPVHTSFYRMRWISCLIICVQVTLLQTALPSSFLYKHSNVASCYVVIWAYWHEFTRDRTGDPTLRNHSLSLYSLHCSIGMSL